MANPTPSISLPSQSAATAGFPVGSQAQSANTVSAPPIVARASAAAAEAIPLCKLDSPYNLDALTAREINPIPCPEMVLFERAVYANAKDANCNVYINFMDVQARTHIHRKFEAEFFSPDLPRSLEEQKKVLSTFKLAILDSDGKALLKDIVGRVLSQSKLSLDEVFTSKEGKEWVEKASTFIRRFPVDRANLHNNVQRLVNIGSNYRSRRQFIHVENDILPNSVKNTFLSMNFSYEPTTELRDRFKCDICGTYFFGVRPWHLPEMFKNNHNGPQHRF